MVERDKKKGEKGRVREKRNLREGKEEKEREKGVDGNK